MSNYTITTNFGAKDDLPSGNAAKVIKGSEFTTEFTNIKTAVNSKADSVSPTFTGNTALNGTTTFGPDGTSTFNGTVNFTKDVTFDTDTMFVDVSANRVGIGTTSPATALDVTGTVTASGLTVDTDTLHVDATNDRVGIGTTSPLKDLNVSNTTGSSEIMISTSDTGTGSLEFGDVTSGAVARGFLKYNHSDNSLQFGSAQTERMRIDSSGKVGIGTTSPAQKLDVNGNIRVQGTFPKIEFVDTDSNPDFTLIGGNGSISFYDETNSTERMRIDSSGNVGIGTSSPDFPLEVSKVGTSGVGSIGLVPDADNGHYIRFGGTGTNNDVLRILGVADAERMRIDTSGNLLVGKTASSLNTTGIQLQNDGLIRATKSGAAVLQLNRQSDGAIATFYKDGSTVGSIGAETSNYLYIGNGDTNLAFSSGSDLIFPRGTEGAQRDAAIDLGNGSNRFKDIYANNGTIQTSDRNEKQGIRELLDAEQRVATACKGLLRAFKWNSAVEEKGDEARIHFGIIAQDLQNAFTAEGLDAGDYAMFINSTWTDEETGEERSRMGVRYSELLAFIISAI